MRYVVQYVTSEDTRYYLKMRYVNWYERTNDFQEATLFNSHDSAWEAIDSATFSDCPEIIEVELHTL